MTTTTSTKPRDSCRGLSTGILTDAERKDLIRLAHYWQTEIGWHEMWQSRAHDILRLLTGTEDGWYVDEAGHVLDEDGDRVAGEKYDDDGS